MRGVFFGLEYDNDVVPNANVIAGTRSGKFTKWVQEYNPVWISRADGKKVLRERRVVQCPTGWHLRKDEIHGMMKEHKTDSYQDGKFYVIEGHAIGVFIHPLKAKMEEEAKEKADAELVKSKSDAAEVTKPVVAEPDSATENKSVPVNAWGTGYHESV